MAHHWNVSFRWFSICPFELHYERWKWRQVMYGHLSIWYQDISVVEGRLEWLWICIFITFLVLICLRCQIAGLKFFCLLIHFIDEDEDECSPDLLISKSLLHDLVSEAAKLKSMSVMHQVSSTYIAVCHNPIRRLSAILHFMDCWKWSNWNLSLIVQIKICNCWMCSLVKLSSLARVHIYLFI